ncbi:MAG: DUF4124 domain-containing protein [Burkholderiales bacterium]|nr:DUF4124 domain-containing protein [Burkholderiales bacterium]MDE1928755.1 DUF4124 domain-containing protein [Burkholderiales bacterium]MDE2502495.1 DUF4124 domain-containing protein [Burkholderiales bacterium]
MQRRPTLPRALTCLAVAALGWSALPAQAQWMWRDAQGHVTVSDRAPPREIPDKDILRRPAADAHHLAFEAPASAAAGAASAPKTALEREVEARKRKAAEEQAAKSKAEDARIAAQKAENCERAHAQQALLASGQRVARVNAQGERVVLDDAGRAAEQRQVDQVIASDCR